MQSFFHKIRHAEMRLSMADKKIEEEKHRSEKIEETGQVTLDKNNKSQTIHLISVIGEVEGHDNLSNNSKTTKYEHILPELAAIEDSSDIDGVLILLNTMGGDVEAGLAISECRLQYRQWQGVGCRYTNPLRRSKEHKRFHFRF